MGIKEVGAVVVITGICLVGTLFICAGTCKTLEKFGFQFS